MNRPIGHPSGWEQRFTWAYVDEEPSFAVRYLTFEMVWNIDMAYGWDDEWDWTIIPDGD
jgi:hypothetical protein